MKKGVRMVRLITVLPAKQNIFAPDGAILLDVLRQHGLARTPPAVAAGSADNVPTRNHAGSRAKPAPPWKAMAFL